MSFQIIGNASSGKVKVRLDEVVQGVRHRKQVCCFRNEVQAVYRQWLTDIKNTAVGKFTFEQKLPEYLEHLQNTTRQSTFIRCKRVLDYACGILGKLYLEEISGTDIDRFLWCMRRDKPNYKKNTLNLNLTILHGFFSWSQQQGFYSKLNPVLGKKFKCSNTREVYLSLEEIADLIDRAYALNQGFGLQVELAVKSGMRLSEIKNLLWPDIDLANKRIIIPAERSKSGEIGTAHLTNQLVDKLNDLKKSVTGDKVFKIFNVHYYWLNIRNSLPRAKDGSYMRFHDLRHCYGQSLFDIGTPIDDVQKLMRHKHLSTTQAHYVHLSRPDLGQKVQKLDEVFKRKNVNSMSTLLSVLKSS